MTSLSMTVPFPLPKEVVVELRPPFLSIRGPLGVTQLCLPMLDPRGLLGVCVTEAGLSVVLGSRAQASLGLFRGLLRSAVLGVTRGHLRVLRMQGVGYRVDPGPSVAQQVLTLKLGYSHDVWYRLPQGVRAFLTSASTLCLVGVDRAQVHQVAAELMALRPYTPYQPKGLLPLGVLPRKVGKRK
jgi:large subunit ribosomal protein L6